MQNLVDKKFQQVCDSGEKKKIYGDGGGVL